MDGMEAVDQGGRFVAVVNRFASANLHEADVSNRELGSLFIEHPERIAPVETMPDDLETVEKIVKVLNQGDGNDVIIPFGGEGTLSTVTAALRHPDLDDTLRNSTVVPGLFGNANLVAQQLIKPLEGMIDRPRLLDIIGHGWVVDGWGVDVTVKSPYLAEAERYLAMACHGILVSGRIATALNDVREHGMRRSVLGRDLIDGRAGYKALRGSEVMRFSVNDEELEGVGSIGVNTDRYIKHLNTPSSIDERAFHELTITNNTRRYIAATLLRYGFRGLPGASGLPWRRVEGDESITYRVIADKGQQLSIDVDAEPRPLPYDEGEEVESVITTMPATRSIKFVTTNPALAA